MNQNDMYTNSEEVSAINNIHDEALVQHFVDGIGKKVIMLIPNFPFMFIGFIKDVIEDVAVLDVISSTQAALENREWHVHIHTIEVFFIERDGGPLIPELQD